MKFFTSKETTKKIIIAILLVMSFNFITPVASQADFGGALFKPISQLLCGVSDLVIKGLQKYFTGVGDIKYGGISEIESDSFFIRYSPGIIFSGKVAGLKVNFINAKESDKETIADETFSWDEMGEYSRNSLPGFSDPNFNKDEVYCYTKITDNNWYELTTAKAHIIYTWEYNGQKYTAVNTNAKLEVKDFLQMHYANVNLLGGFVSSIKLIDTIISSTGNNWNLYRLNTTVNKTVTKSSSAYLLQDTVATWYKALRAIALVGLLSVLVYIGIRVLISSTGQEKAKYKKMIGDWVAAICILFVLQYIMLFITEITQKITDVLSINIIGPNGEDVLMSNLRSNVGDSTDFSEIFPEMLMYMVLVIYTVMFTIQYLKRLLYMAFFTMIAPLIALTYPLDKIKDGQAQAFSMWVREYTFNALLQPMHLLLYYMFVASATSLVSQNPLYAVVAIGFLLPAEKFFRKMFGFEKASSAGQIGAAAGGALIMNAINKMGHKSGKQAAGKATGGEGSKAARMASSNANTIGTGGPNSTTAGGSSSGSSGGGTAGGFGSARTANTHGATMGNALSGGGRSIRNGVSAVRRKYINKNTAKSVGRMARRGALGALGAATLGSAGLAAGIATGDLGKAMQYGAAGAGAGYMGANYAGDKLLSGEKNLRETFKEGAIGQDEYNNLKMDKAFYESDEFRGMLNDRELESGKKGKERTTAIRNAVQTYRDNGITDTSKIKTAMKSGLTPQEGAYAVKLADMIGRSGWNNPKTREDFEKRYKSAIPGASGDKIWKSIESLL